MNIFYTETVVEPHAKTSYITRNNNEAFYCTSMKSCTKAPSNRNPVHTPSTWRNKVPHMDLPALSMHAD